jgi:hypothetical protein
VAAYAVSDGASTVITQIASMQAREGGRAKRGSIQAKERNVKMGKREYQYAC